jgi:hypothetical protein
MNHYEHLIKKPFEAMCGCVLKMPVSFSAYNMDILTGGNGNSELLKEYFTDINDKISTEDITETKFAVKDILLRVILPKAFQCSVRGSEEDSEEHILYNLNVYESEDPILCLGIYKSQRNIMYMPDVEAQVASSWMLNDLMKENKR